MKFNTGRTIRLSVLASAIALTLSASPALAQDNTTGLLKGTISAQNGNQLADVVITLRHLQQGFSRTVQTNSKHQGKQAATITKVIQKKYLFMLIISTDK